MSFQDSYEEFHQALKSLYAIPGALTCCTGTSNLSNTIESGDSQEIEMAHRRALRRMERFLSSLADVPLEELEFTEYRDNDAMMIDDDDVEEEEDPTVQSYNNEVPHGAVGQEQHANRPLSIEVQSQEDRLPTILSVLQNDLVIIVQALAVVDEDATKRELAEACIVASAEAIVTLNCVLSSDDAVVVLNRLLLLTGEANGNEEEDDPIPRYLIWVLNKQFENGVEIQSSSIAVLATSEILEMMAQEVSNDILPEDVNSTQRSWCTLASFLLRFSLPKEMYWTDLEDLRHWLVRHLSKVSNDGEIVHDKASRWMSNLFRFTQSMATLALDALDMNDEYAIYYATISTQTLKRCGTESTSELQPILGRLWTTLASSYLEDDNHCMETPLQHSVASLTLELFDGVCKPDQSTTILMFLRALEFPELLVGRDHILGLIPHSNLQCSLLTLLRQETTETLLVDRILEILEPTKNDGNYMDKFFWNQVESYLLTDEDIETM